jgi:Arc/MetJ-type ribon-helix-helix transcriptional regulator
MTCPQPKPHIQGSVKLTDEQIELLEELAEGNDYWSNAHEFIHQSLGRELSSLSDKQLDWYYVIEASLNVELDKIEARRAFEYGSQHYP